MVMKVLKEEKVCSIAHTADLAGSGSRKASVREMKKKLDGLRNEDL